MAKKLETKPSCGGAIAGTIPDLDVFMKFFVEELRAIEMHRDFSHSFLFSFIFSPILGWLASKTHKKEGVDWKAWSMLMFGAIVTHPLLDTHTKLFVE